MSLGTPKTDGPGARWPPAPGSACRLAATGRRVVVAGREQDVQTWLDDGQQTLAQDPALAAVAGFLDGLEVTSAQLARDTFAPPDGGPGYDAVGVSEHVVDGHTMVTIAHRLPDATDGQVDQFRTMWQQAVLQPGRQSDDLDVVSAGRDGEVIWVRVRPSRPFLAQRLAEAMAARQGPFVTD